jgi:hypothetical protein
MSDANWALQEAVFAELSANAEVQAVLGDPPRLYDAVPRAAAFPYAVLGDGQETDASTASEAGSEHILAIHVWSRGGGHREAKEIAAAIRDCLDGAALSLAGFALIDLAFRTADYAREPDGETWRAALRFRAVTEPV